MNLKSLQQELFERKMDITEYFGVAFDAFKILLKENKFLMFFSFLITFFTVTLVVVVQILKIVLEIGGWEQDVAAGLMIMSIILLLFNMISSFFKGYFFRKVAFKMENNKSNLKLSELFIKVVITLGICLVLGLVFFFVDDKVAGMLNFLLIVVYVWALLYIEGYYVRSFGLKESIEYSMELSKGNRTRVIVPMVLTVIVIILEVILLMFLLKDESEMITVMSILSFLVFLSITAIIIVYMEILNIVIFLNVENDYLKNKGEYSKFNLKNRQKNDNVLDDEFKSETENKDDNLE